jgi:hypothetical protein
METNGGRANLPSGHKKLWSSKSCRAISVLQSRPTSKSTMVSAFALLRSRMTTTALILLAAATVCITPSSFPLPRLHETQVLQNGEMTLPTTNPTTTPPLNRTTAMSWVGSFLDSALDSQSTHSVSHQLRALLSPLLMPWQPASVLHWWRCLIQSCTDNVIGWVVFFQDACVAPVVYLHGAAVQCTMVCAEAFHRWNLAAVKLVLACAGLIGHFVKELIRSQKRVFNYCLVNVLIVFHNIDWWFQLFKVVVSVMFYTEGQFAVNLLSPIFRKAAAASCPVAEEALDEDAAVLDPVYKKIRKLLRRRYVSQLDRVFREILNCVCAFTHFDVRPAFQQQLPEILRTCLKFQPGVTDEQVRAAVNSIRYTPAMDNELIAMYEYLDMDYYVRTEEVLMLQFASLYRYKLIIRAFDEHGLLVAEECHPEAYRFLFLADWVRDLPRVFFPFRYSA